MRAVLVATTLVLGLGGCASAQTDSPAWLAERTAETNSSFPSLREVPRGTLANTDANHWAEVEADVRAAGEALRASPRSQPVTQADDPAAFLSDAQQQLEEARQAHPN